VQVESNTWRITGADAGDHSGVDAELVAAPKLNSSAVLPDIVFRTRSAAATHAATSVCTTDCPAVSAVKPPGFK